MLWKSRSGVALSILVGSLLLLGPTPALAQTIEPPHTVGVDPLDQEPTAQLDEDDLPAEEVENEIPLGNDGALKEPGEHGAPLAPEESTSVVPNAASSCEGTAPGKIEDGVITVTCGADSGPGTLREAAELSSASVSRVKVEVAPHVGIIELDTGVEFRGQIDLSGDEQSPTVIRPTENFPEDETLIWVTWGSNSQLQGSVSHLHFDLDARAEVGLWFSFEDHEITVETVRVSGATRAGISTRAYDGGSLIVRNSSFDGNGFGGGTGERGGIIINDPYFQEAHANVLVENTEFRDNYQGLRADLWYDPYNAEDFETFEIRGSRFIGNGDFGIGNEVGALVLPWAVGAIPDGSARLKVIDTLFSGNTGQAVGAIQLNSERGLKVPNPLGVSLLISGSTFMGNVAGTQEWFNPATDIGFAGYGFAAVEAPDTVLTMQNSTLSNDGTTPSISLNDDSGEIALDHVTLRGGGVIVQREYPEIAVRNTVIDSGVNDAFSTKSGESGPASLVLNTGSVFTQPGTLELGEGSFVASNEEIALEEIAQGAGATPTMLPRPGSVLLDSAFPSEDPLTADQRGLPRPAERRAADIGAVEVQLGGLRMLGDVAVDEGDPAEFLVELVRAGEHPVTVTAATSDGTAIAGTDYDSTSALFKWEPGETGQKKVTVGTISDEAARADREFTVSLTDPSGAEVLKPGAAIGSIRDISSESVAPPKPSESAPTPGLGAGTEMEPPIGSLSETGTDQLSVLWPLLVICAISTGAFLVRRGTSKSSA